MEYGRELEKTLKKNCFLNGKNDIFVYGEVDKPLSLISEAKFKQNIHENLSKKYRSIYPLQCYSWNEILNGRSVLMIGSKRTGKTFGYLPALLSILANDVESNPSSEYFIENDEEANLDKKESVWSKAGPFAIIFVKSSVDVENVLKICKQIIKIPRLKIVYASGKFNLISKKVELLNGCDLLITTPACFERLSDCEAVTAVDSEKLKYLIYDDLDVLHETFQESLKTSYKLLPALLKKKNSQLIITSSKWRECLRPFMEKYTHVTIIENILEVAILARSCFKFIVSKDTKGADLLKEMTQHDWKFKKTLIICNDEFELKELRSLLSSAGVKLTELTAESNFSVVEESCRQWQQEKEGWMTVLAITNEILHIFNAEIECAQVLIHYSMPRRWSSFKRRFTASLAFYEKMIRNSKTPPSREDRPITFVLLSNENLHQFPRLINMLQDRGIVNELSDEILTKVTEISRMLENQKALQNDSLPLCKYFLRFGDDSKECSCKNAHSMKRHAFISRDKSLFLPLSGFIKFEIIDTLNPLHFIIKITDLLLNDRWISRKEEIQNIEIALKSLQDCLNKCENVKKALIKIGELYCYRDYYDQKWLRCKVLQSNENPKRPYDTFDVEIMLIDKGYRQTVKSTSLSELPAAYKPYEPLVTNLLITNFRPHDFDKNFDRESENKIKAEMSRLQHKVTHGQCDIQMAFEDTVVSKNFKLFTFLDALKVDTLEFNLKTFLLKQELVVEDDSIYPKLLKSMIDAGIYQSSDNIKTAIEPQKLERSEETISTSSSDLTKTFEGGSEKKHEQGQSVGSSSISKMRMKFARFKVVDDSSNSDLSESESIDSLAQLDDPENYGYVPSELEDCNTLSARLLPSTITVKSRDGKQSRSISFSSKISNKYKRLSRIYKQLFIKWNQNDVITSLEIDSTNAIEYSLHVDCINFDILLNYDEMNFGVARFKLFGTIDPKHVAHWRKGNKIEVYLKKHTIGLIWPRLTESAEKNNFIQAETGELKLPIEDNLEAKEVKSSNYNYTPAGFSDVDGKSESYASSISGEFLYMH